MDLVNSDQITFGEKVNFCVPSGNFGDILAGYYAYKMGVPVNKLICASNKNKVLTDFFETGTYDINRDFYKTISPSMDILISSNLERLLYEITGKDDKKVVSYMKDLKTKGKYTISEEELNKIKEIFDAGYADEDMTKDAIAAEDEVDDYIMDPHTGVAMAVYDDYLDRTNDETKTIILSTASAYKFPCDVYEAITESKLSDAFEATKKLQNFTGLDIPEPLMGLKNREVRFNDIIEKTSIADAVLEYVNKGE